jgi:hypothetical protein
MTIEQIAQDVSPDSPISRRQVYRYLDALGITPNAVRRRPQHYPDDSAARIGFI